MLVCDSQLHLLVKAEELSKAKVASQSTVAPLPDATSEATLYCTS
jgi:hypothetical protein